MSIILFDDQFRSNLLPLTFLRPVAGIRVGILTIAEKWKLHFKKPVSYLTQTYLQKKYPLTTDQDNVFINGSICPDSQLLEVVDKLPVEEALVSAGVLIALKLGESDARSFRLEDTGKYPVREYPLPFLKVSYPEDIFLFNDVEIRKDFLLITRGRSSAPLSTTNTVLGDHIFVEEGVEAECSTFNTLNGPVYLGRDSKVLEGSHIRGSFALCERSLVKMGARIYSMTTIGPDSKVGGEINNSVIFGNSSKGHDGYLGNSVIGEWCNMGADSNNSNMKNNYTEVKLWDYTMEGFRRTGLQFCGLIMGDHSKCGINTMFNTGTVVGISANIFGSGFPRNFVPDFAWGGSQGFETYGIHKAAETVSRVFERKDLILDDIDKRILTDVFDLTGRYRRF